jgi:hypothetical protein
MKIILRAAFAAALLTAALLLACGDGGTTPAPTIPTGVSPESCMSAIMISWYAQNYGAFKPYLAHNFTFYFNPHDVGTSVGSYTLPASWTYAQMCDAVFTMLANAYSIDMHIPGSSIGTPGDADNNWRAERIPLTLTVMTDAHNGFRVGAGCCHYSFARYTEDGKYQWYLKGWWDFTSATAPAADVPGVEPTSLGRILARYYGGE